MDIVQEPAESRKAPPPLLEPALDDIPVSLKSRPRAWTIWRAAWLPHKGKHSKVPCRVDSPEHGVSTAAKWWSFDAAARAHDHYLGAFAGVGLRMEPGLVGIDLDNCVRAGHLEPWAQAIVDEACSYAELSPSGNGVRIFLTGRCAEDWNNHAQGIEVYGGNAPRFLTVTGHRLPGAPAEVNPAQPGFLTDLVERYRVAKPKEAVAAADVPDLVPADRLPELNLSEAAEAFLRTGEADDRSAALAAAAVEVLTATADAHGNLQPRVALTVLHAAPGAWQVALDHRRQDDDRALEYLWKHHVQPGMTKARPVWTEFEDLGPDPAHAEKRLRFMPIPAAEFAAARPPAWIIKGVLPQAELAVVYGASGSGKSFLVLDIAGAIARGVDWRGHRVRRGRVVYVAAEGASGMRKRLAAYGLEHDLQLRDLDLAVIPDAPNLLQDDDKALAEAIQATGGADVVIVDTLAQATAGANENAGEDMGKVLGHCKRLHRATGALVLLVHHSGKDEARGARGWSGIRAAVDAEIEVTREGDTRVARVSKQKDGEDGAFFTFRLVAVELGRDEDGDAITSCYVEHTDDRPTVSRAPKGSVQRLVWEVVNELADLDLSRSIPVEQVINAAAPRLTHDPSKRDKRRDHVTRALDSLRASDFFTVEGDAVVLPHAPNTPQGADGA